MNSPRQSCRALALLLALLLSGPPPIAAQSPAPGPRFAAAEGAFPQDLKDLRKWDAPTVADLDQDGWPDLILNDHGYGIRILWNNKGRYAKPYDLLMGDIHGVTVADFDRDGRLDLVLSRGGGSGSNARNAKLFTVDRDRKFHPLDDFPDPLETMRGRTVKFTDLDGDGWLDLINFAFPDRSRKGASENYLYRNDRQGRLVLGDTLPPVGGDGQKTLVTDFDGDGSQDLLLYGAGQPRAFRNAGDFQFREVTATVLPESIGDISSAVELDYDNDGDFDLFLTRMQPFEAGETFYDPATRIWGFYSSRGRFVSEPLPADVVLKLENYHTTWPHTAFYLGETGYAHNFRGETHTGRSFEIVNSDALGFPEQLSEQGGYLGFIGNGTWRLAVDTWSAATGVIHGVREYPAYPHPAPRYSLLLENRDGRYVDATDRAGAAGLANLAGAVVADFDNDGHVDILALPRGNLISPLAATLLRNRQDGTFAAVPYHGVNTTDLGSIGMGGAAVDYNADGKVDVIVGNERGQWQLFENQSAGAGRGATIRVGHSPSGAASPLGAVVSLTAEHTRTVRIGNSAAAYGTQFDSNVHFGLGNFAGPARVEVRWPTGERVTAELPAGQQTLNVGDATPITTK
ncbi:hypothetical protein GGR26_001732 [Lewinella marina]|uniref:ASPIC/UnbV domain-containing protein n=1 Tax=Neolewinella marina TaxID=438751 RepID=A0A2G0CDN5_9BACT|nr:CRTAC1 family protein [Neolewinella marina]NJB85964.1 hypothetical protein [Neolewinella marina]PHK98065.1 hypothetical protein CGL56_12810 [Neolewinella marina]